MSEEEVLRDVLYDQIAEARHTLRVTYNKSQVNKPAADDGATFFVSFLLTVDAKTHQLLCATAEKKERSVAELLRRYVVSCFSFCIAEQDEDEGGDELKAA
jgi:hypothetical protein